MRSSDYLSSPVANRWHDVAYWMLLAVACAVFYWMNVLTPFKEDDMVHSLVSGEWTHMRTFGDFLRSCWNKYFVLNGRTSDMTAELFCGLLGKPLFNVLNTLMFALLAHVVSLLATGRRSLLAQSMLYACVATCYPVPGETLLWLAGSCNYLWSITVSLWGVYFLLHHRNARQGWLKEILLFLCAFWAGASNEATSFAFLAGMFLYYAFNRRLIDRAVVIVLTGYLLGVVFIVLSPGIWQRASSGGIAVDMSVKDLLFSRCYIVGEKMLRYLLPVIALMACIVALFWKGVKPLKGSALTYLFVMMLFLLLVFGQNHERPYAPFVTVSLIIVVFAADAVLKHWPWLRMAAIAGCMALSAYLFARGIKVLQDYKVYDERVVNEIRSAPSQAILRECPYKGYSRFLFTLPMKSDWFFPNEYTWRGYFDKENVQFVSDSIYDRFHSGRLLEGAIEMPFGTDQPALAGHVVAFPDQDYMILPLQLDTIPAAYQVGTAFWNDSVQGLSAEELAYRRKHGVMSKSDPFGYYPLRYQGRVLMVLPLMDDKISSMEVLLDYAGDYRLMLYRKGANPDGVKKIEK